MSTRITLLDTHAPISKVSTPTSAPSPAVAKAVDDSFNPHGASIDTSRIIRADYSNPIYTALASLAQERWREDEALRKHYHESGLAVVGNRGQRGWQYIEKSRRNVVGASPNGTDLELGNQEVGNTEELVQSLENEEEIRNIMNTGGRSGEAGYVNWRSGWADAGAAMGSLRRRVTTRAQQQGRKLWLRGRAEQLLFANTPSSTTKRRITGVQLDDGSKVRAELVILAAGAWTGSLVDLRGIVEATGQAVAYVPLSSIERQKLQDMPVLLNLATGMFAIPPSPTQSPDPHLKIARHAYGYRNPIAITDPSNNTSRTVSLPSPHFSPIPPEAERECRTFLAAVVPWLADRPFAGTRLCWYTDTPEGNFVVDYHPNIGSLFCATGGSGHAFKFLPVLGDKVVEALEGRLESGLRGCWTWPERNEGFSGTEDGSRGGQRGTLSAEEGGWGKSKL